MARPFFSRDRVADFDNFEAHANTCVTLLKARLSAGFPVDIQDAVARFTLDSATTFLFGHDFGSLHAGLPYPEGSHLSHGRDVMEPAEAFGVALRVAQERLAERIHRGPIWPLFELFNDATKEPMKVIDSFVEPILRRALQRHAESPREEEYTFLDYLVRQTTDKKILKDEIMSMLAAARDTTAATLTFSVYCLARYPDVLARLRAEVLEHVERGGQVTFDQIRDMKYLRAFINEVLRLYPPVPVNSRQTVHETTWPNRQFGEKPYYVPGNTQ